MELNESVSEENNYLNNSDAEELGSIRDALMAAVYSDTAKKLFILQKVLRMHAPKSRPQKKQSLREKLDNSTLLKESVENLIDESILDALKFERDLEKIRGVYDAAFDNLRLHKSDLGIEHVEQAVEALRIDTSADIMVMASLEATKSELSALKDELEHLKIESFECLQLKNEAIADIKCKLKTVSHVNELEYDLVKRWEANRLAQVNIWAEKKERAYLCDIIEYKRRLTGEKRIMHEVQSYRNGEFNELRKKYADWQKKFDVELKRAEDENQAEEIRILQMYKSLERLREIYEQRVAFVRDYEAQKAEEERLLALQAHRVECVVRIQAWWRGIMVRRGLGPFKRKPKKSKKRKSKK